MGNDILALKDHKHCAHFDNNTCDVCLEHRLQITMHAARAEAFRESAAYILGQAKEYWARGDNHVADNLKHFARQLEERGIDAWNRRVEVGRADPHGEE